MAAMNEQPPELALRKRGFWGFVRQKRVWMPVVALLVIAVVVSFFRGEDQRTSLAFSDVVEAGRIGELEEIEVRGNTLHVRLRDSATLYESRVGDDVDLVAALREEGVTLGTAPDSVQVEYRAPTAFGTWAGLAINLLFLVPFGLVMYFAVLFALRRNSQTS
jgi:hypothetical protein